MPRTIYPPGATGSPTAFQPAAIGWRERLLASEADVGALVARLALGGVMFAHGAQKALGWFGGPGFAGTMDAFTRQMHIPAAFALLAIAAEFLGSLGLITGLLGRVAAFGIMCNMLVAIAMVHVHHGFFMNWGGTLHGEGFEYHVLAIGLALVVMINGSGALSLDRWLTRDDW
jgi:putative oxidoreductase